MRRASSLFLMLMLFSLLVFPGCLATGFRGASVEDIFDTSDSTTDFQVSPDGSMVAWIAFKDHFKTIFFKPADGGKDDVKSIDTHSWCYVSGFRWAGDSRHLVYSLFSGRNRPDHLYLSDTQSPDAAPVNLTPNAKNRAYYIASSLSGPGHVLYSQDKFYKDGFGLYETDLDAKIEKPVISGENEAVVKWLVDHHGRLRGCIRAQVNHDLKLERYLEKKKEWVPLDAWKTGDQIEGIGVTPDGKGFWLLSDRGRDRMALVRYDTASGKEILVYEHPRADVEGIYQSPVTGKVLFAYVYPDYPETVALEPDLEADLEFLKAGKRCGIRILGMDHSENLWTVEVYDETRSEYYLYHRREQKKTFLGENDFFAEESMHADTRPVVIESRDGMMLNGYLTRPAQEQPKALPMVLLVHGGPWARDYWKPDAMVQLFALRGYTVLQVNFRGSTGYGRKYRQAGRREFCGKMYTDLTDAVHWAVDQGIADPEKIAVVGGSYGGYAAMAGLAFSPDLFTCAVAINGVSDWVQLAESRFIPPSLLRARAYQTWERYLGDPYAETDKKEMEQCSPYFFVDRIKKPILMIYGEQDQTVDPENSKKMIQALKKSHGDVSTLKFENEGHSIGWTHNSKRMFVTIDRFLAKQIGR